MRMTALDKIQPLGVCDRCLAVIPKERWYTSKGKPRRYCSVDCRNAGNSHEGEAIRYRKLVERIERGEWENPAKLKPPTPEEQAERARKGRLREVDEGRWRNPAYGEDAREKLSRPRKHSGALASAIEKLGRGLSVADLTEEEREAHRAWRRELQRQKKPREK
jgi:hypothetical protein